MGQGIERVEHSKHNLTGMQCVGKYGHENNKIIGLNTIYKVDKN